MRYRICWLAVATLIAGASRAALAWPGGAWAGPGGGPGRGPGWNDGNSNDRREGRVLVDRFVAPNARPALNQRQVAVVTAPGEPTDAHDAAIFEAAVLDALARAGYDTVNPAPQSGLVAQVRTGRDIVVPQEPRHSPLSGEMGAGVSNRGSGFGLGLSLDLRKPRKALIDTRLELRIVDRASGRSLWEGRADIITREGDAHWSDAQIAGRLATALFDHFAGPKA